VRNRVRRRFRLTGNGKNKVGIAAERRKIDRRRRYHSGRLLYSLQRLLKKVATAASLVPQPVPRPAAKRTRLGAIFFGSTSPAMHEALDVLASHAIHVNALRLRAFPFPASVKEFIDAHDLVFVVEQNRDAQMRSLLINELEINPAKLQRVLHYDGTPITARFITTTITDHVHQAAVAPQEIKP
jgi:2-oxoglutarate ferredoxin oxidoreductase subunit alpha